MSKPTIAVIFGSRSTEHDISVLTAISSVIKPLELSKQYTVLPVYISKTGAWYTSPEFTSVKTFQSTELAALLARTPPLSLSLAGGLSLIAQGRLGRKIYNIDIVFPALHGTHGEDGEVMAICEMANVPYVGCDVAASVTAMDKVLAKQVALANDILTAKFISFSKADYQLSPESYQRRIQQELRYPLFVKPAHLGSSIGISRVTDAKDLANAIEVALHYDTKALVEEGVENLIEVTLPILGNEELTPALLEEPLLKSEDFFDFNTKYMQGGKGKGGAKTSKQGAQGYSRLPAELPKGLYEIAESMGVSVYRALGCSGMARIDMLVDSKAKEVYFNEVNPLPGSLYAHNFAQAGISNVELVTTLVKLAQQRFQSRQAITTSFSTNYLQQF